MIPKIIHYCWFSDPPDYPPLVLKCIESWKKFLPDYEIKLWNAKNFDLSQYPYAQEAYNERKFAFASDVVRLHVLLRGGGGIYLDSDIEVVKNFDTLLNNKAFTCFEAPGRIAAWILASEEGNPLFRELLDYYKGRHFILAPGVYDMTPNPVPITEILTRNGLKHNNNLQQLENITVYPMEYFCPFNPYRKEPDCFTKNTFAIHHFNGSWQKISNEREQKYLNDVNHYEKSFGKKWGSRFIRIKYLGFIKTFADIIHRKFHHDKEKENSYTHN